MKYPLIGGKSDGKYRMAYYDSDPILRVPYYPPLQHCVYGNEEIPMELHMPVETYHCEILHSQGRSFFFFRHKDLSVDDAIQKLLSNYRP